MTLPQKMKMCFELFGDWLKYRSNWYENMPIYQIIFIKFDMTL